MRKNVVPCPKAAKSRMVPQSSCIRMNNERFCTEQKNCTHFPCSFFHLNSHLGPHTPKILRTEKAPGLLCPEPISIPFLIPLPSFVLLTCIHYYLRSFLPAPFLTSIIPGICISCTHSLAHLHFMHLPFPAFMTSCIHYYLYLRFLASTASYFHNLLYFLFLLCCFLLANFFLPFSTVQIRRSYGDGSGTQIFTRRLYFRLNQSVGISLPPVHHVHLIRLRIDEHEEIMPQ